MDKLLLAVGVGVVLWLIGDVIVRIIKAGKGSAPGLAARVDDLEADLAAVEADLDDARGRIQVLEQIVTDGRRDLGGKADRL